MSYQQERDQFIARMTKEGLPLDVTTALLRAATTLQRYAELATSSEWADRDRVPCPAATEVLRRFTCRCVGEGVDRCVACEGKRTLLRLIARKPTGPCLCDDYPAGSHAAGKHNDVTRITVQAWRLEQRLTKILAAHNVRAGHYTGNETQRGLWEIDTQGDPRGYVLRVIPPSYAERNEGRDKYNRDTIGVPSGRTGLRF